MINKKNIAFKFPDAAFNTDGQPYEKCLIILISGVDQSNTVFHDQLSLLFSLSSNFLKLFHLKY